jgi:hypothetical protein
MSYVRGEAVTNYAPRMGIILGELELVLSNDVCVLVEYYEPDRTGPEM